MLLTYILTILISATLLFTVQPFMAKLVLPQLGGSPAVWNTCMVFFQAMLLGGYSYAHLLARRISQRTQVLVHFVVCLIPLAMLPPLVAPNSGPGAGGSPALWLLGVLAVSIGPAFFVLASTGPLLQRWFSETGHPRAKDPYFLYVAGNFGSLAGLLAYPFLIEPFFRLSNTDASRWVQRTHPVSQSVLWSLGYVLFVVMILMCGVLGLRRARSVAAAPDERTNPAEVSAVPLRRRLRWLALAFVPSSAMLGTTQYLTTDIAAIPMLWVFPLALYLVTMMLAFSRRLRISPAFAASALALLAVVVAASFWGFGREMIWFKMSLHLAVLFAVGMLCHGLLAEDRPKTDRLTLFYLLVAVGGVAGGAFNALAAPLLFNSVAEYPVILVLACLFFPGKTRTEGKLRRLAFDVGLPMILAAAIIGLWNVIPSLALESLLQIKILQIILPCLVCLLFMRRGRRFALGLTVLFLAGWWQTAPFQFRHQERTFFGVHKVIDSLGVPYHVVDEVGRTRIERTPIRLLVHGTTGHGSQAAASPLSLVPTMYYHPSGPVGQIFGSLNSDGSLHQVAIVGLGAGTLAAYGKPGQVFTYFEIDPAVVRIAKDEGLFTYLRDSRAENVFVVGDGRQALDRRQDGLFDLIVLDAFSSDAVPVHLLTREAVQIYLKKLRPGGLLALHLTNSYLDLRPVVEAICIDLGIHTLVQRDPVVTPRQRIESKNPSVWAIVAIGEETLKRFRMDPRWRGPATLESDPPKNRHLWTDNSSNIISVLRFGGS